MPSPGSGGLLRLVSSACPGSLPNCCLTRASPTRCATCAVKDEAGGITGVYSLSERKPLKQAGFPRSQTAFEQAESYQQWLFLFQTAADSAGQAAAAKATP